MHLLIIGSDAVSSIERYYAKYLRELGVNVNLFPIQRHFYAYYHESLLNRALFRLQLSPIYARLNRQVMDTIDVHPPDVVWVFKGMEVFPETLAAIRARGIPLVNYNPDNPFLFSGRGSGNANITRSIGLYDLHFTYNLSIEKRLRAEFRARTAWLPFGFEVSADDYAACIVEPEVIKACFIGNPDRQRMATLAELSQRGVDLVVHGHGWDKFVGGTRIAVGPPAYGMDQLKNLRGYRVQLNLLRPHNMDSHNMRTFEIPGIGGIMVAADTREHRQFFEAGSEAFFFKDAAAAVELIQVLLALPRAEADQIRQRARRRSVDSRYSYRDRAEAAWRELNRL